MKKSIITFVIILMMSIFATNNIYACRHYMKLTWGVSAVDYASNKFNSNCVGGKVNFGFTSYIDYITCVGTFEMYGKNFGKPQIVDKKDWGVGVDLRLNPFAVYYSNVRFLLVGSVNYYSTNFIGNYYGGRLELGNPGTYFFAQYTYGFNYGVNNKTFDCGHKIELGVCMSIEIGKGKIM